MGNGLRRHFQTAALRDNEAEVSVHNSCFLLMEGCSWECEPPTLPACPGHWAETQQLSVCMGTLAVSSSEGQGVPGRALPPSAVPLKSPPQNCLTTSDFAKAQQL